MPNRKNRLLVPAADSRLDAFKYEIASELGYPGHIGQSRASEHNWNQIMDAMKYELATELGLTPQIENGYWGNVSSRACGAVGGRIGGKLGGNMVRRMILFAEQNLLR
ncbi:small, acid-soluble spore protein, alpha/beta type [Desulfofundulus thermobenzoicus]|uniref:Small, acid-soluble spore protein, alpha/beta type n=1 Tax=Desulfofundulus thermobenzoicus TaxID=29376 RepID=A0A6N7IVI2_9FIRM|nr:alpha/beta-type small acid-soluble spore protein [Desulfofundulus thermobenzoicus]MQL53148.1 small, acid-soluble spore protein, alpha/beta type [Desulfofundulus thermobenzoicus]